jgi:sulfite exporter TauE/SafE
VINQNQVVIGVLMGLALIVFGLAPGLLRHFANQISNIADQMSSRMSIPDRTEIRIRPSRWLIALGVFVITLTFLAYYSN